MKRPKLPKLRWSTNAGTVLFAIAAFLASLYYTFPEQVVSDRLEREVAQASGGQVQARVQRANLWRFSGLYAQNVEVRMGEAAPITFDTVRLRLRLLPLLLGRLSVYGQVQLEGGTLDVVLTRRGKVLDLQADMDAINLAKPKALGEALGMALAGQLTGSVELEGVEDMVHSKGKIDLRLVRAAVGPGEVRGLSLPALPLGDLSLAGEVKDGVVAIKQLRQEGGKLQLTGGGKVSFGRQLAASSLDVCLRIGADKDFLAENPKLSAVLQIAQAQLKRDADGMLNLPLQGRVGAPEVRPALCPRR